MEQILAIGIIALFVIFMVIPAIGASLSDGFISYSDALKGGLALTLVVIFLGVGTAAIFWAFETLFGG